MGGSGVKRIIYKRVTAQDEKKLEARSNKAETGGGARDLRLGPWIKFEPALKRMFPTPSPGKSPAGGGEVHVGQIHWFASSDAEEASAKEAEVWPPTNARPSEGRIARVHTISPFSKDALPDESQGAAFFLLWQDGSDAVWGRFVSEAELRSGAWNPQVAGPIINCLEASTTGNVRGYIDFEHGTEEHFK